MNTNLFNLPNTPRNHTTTNNSLENNQRSVNDIVYLYRDITHGIRDVMNGYNNVINNYNQNIARYLSTINEYRNDVRTMRSQLFNDLPHQSLPNAPSTPIRSSQNTIPRPQVRPYRTRSTNVSTMGTTESRTFSSPESLFSNLFTFPINTGARSYEDVIVCPTQQEIDNAIEVFNYTENDSQNHHSCPITMEEFVINDRVSRIRHCGHTFREEAINNWFRLNVRCPVCRYDIREYTNNNDTMDVSGNDTMDVSGNTIDISSSNINANINDITNQLTTELTNLLTQAWRTQLQSNMSDNSQNPIFSFDIPITVTSTYDNEYDEDDDDDL